MKIPTSLRGWLLSVALLTLLSQNVFAQYTAIGDVTFASSIFGPMVGRSDSNVAYSRHAYIYPAATLGSLKHGDSIRMLQFYKFGTGRYTANPRFVIHMGMSKAADFGTGNIKSWTAETKKNGTRKVFDNGVGSIVDSTQGFKSFWLDTIFVVDTSLGTNLKIMVEFYQTTKQVNGQIPIWGYENDASVTGFISNNETKYIFSWGNAPDTTNASQVRKPTLRIFHPRVDASASVDRIYCLGELALLMNPIDTIKARVFNTGRKMLINHPFELEVSGANSFLDTVYIDTLRPFETKMIHFVKYKPSRKGTDSIRVSSINDGYPDDDTLRQRRDVSQNVLSHNNPYVANSPFGIGFTGSSGDFVAKFYTDSSYINQVKIGFSTTGLPFKLAIWEEGANHLPGKVLYESDTLYTNGGQYIQPVLPRVRVEKAYFVGIRQASGNNVGFVYEPEVPVRSGAFYFAAPIGDTNWVSFSPGYDFNFDIQPRIQVDHDLAVLRISYPEDSDTLEFSITDSVAPKATIFNFGAKDENNPFDVVCKVTNQFGSVVYQSTRVVTLKANDSLEITFDSTLALSNYGPLKMEVYTKLAGELAPENDTATITCYIFVNYDVQVETFFNPTNGQQVELNIEKIPPTVRIFNFGIKDQKGIAVTSRVRQGTQIAGVQTIFMDVDGNGSKIVTFDSVTVPFLGQAIFEVFCWNTIDSFPINDTARVTVNVIRSNDLGIVSVLRPEDSSVYLRKQEFRPYINYRNFGLADQDSVRIHAIIYQEDGTIIYSDTVYANVDKLSSLQTLFKRFTAPDSAQTLYFHAKTFIKNDQDTSNDEITTKFFIRTNVDLKLSEIVQPKYDSLYLVGDTIHPALFVSNIGNTAISGTKKFKVVITDPAQNIVYSDSSDEQISLNFGDNDSIYFSNDFIPQMNGVYNVVMYVANHSDGERSNDTLRNSFKVSYKYSFKMVSILEPQSTNYQLTNDTIKPSIVIENIGKSDAESTIYYTLKANDGTSDVFVYNDSITALDAGQSVISNASDYFLPPTTGSYTMTATLANSDDQVASDNEQSVGFTVSLANDVRPVTFVLPEADSLVYANRTYAPQAEFENIGDSNQTAAFSVSFIIEFNQAVVYNSNRSILLDAGKSQVVKFDQTFRPTIRGTYTMTIISRLGTDQVNTNDTLTAQFEVDYHSGLQDLYARQIEVYPNPTNGVVSINTTNLNATDLEVYDELGRAIDFEVVSSSATGWTIEIDRKSTSASVLFVGVKTPQLTVWKRLLLH